MGTQDSILFIDKVFLKRAKAGKPLRGVELFNLILCQDLMQAGYPVTMLVQPSWQPPLQEFPGVHRPSLFHPPEWGLPVLQGLYGALRLQRPSFETLLIGNAGDGIIPTVRLLHRLHRFRRTIAIVHRMPSDAFVRLCRQIGVTVLCVNRPIANAFSKAGCTATFVDYGIMQGAAYYPAPTPNTHDPIHFCVLGALDNAWKGADTAIAAFDRIPAALRTRAHLHLASFEAPPVEQQPGITFYPWMPASRIPSFLRNMDVLVVPSRDEDVMRETFSQATVQGMLTGLPILYNRLPILEEKFDQGGGIPFTSSTELAEGMAALIIDPDRRRQLGRESRQTALDRYIWDTNRFIHRYLIETA